MGRKGMITIEILSLIFVPGALTVFVIGKLTKFLTKIHLKRS